MNSNVVQDEIFMRAAIAQAELAAQNNEVPVGAVLVKDGEIIAAAHNQPIASNDPTSHAEILVLRHAAQQLNNYRLNDTTLYVSLEPCAMCLGAMQHARVKRCVFGARDTKTGVLGGCCDLLQDKWALHKMQVDAGVLAEDCAKLLKDFFKRRR